MIVLKYPLNESPFISKRVTYVQIPRGSKVLRVQAQGGRDIPTLWVAVPDGPSGDPILCAVYLALTGRQDDGADFPWHDYLGTVQVMHGEYVMHFFYALVDQCGSHADNG